MNQVQKTANSAYEPTDYNFIGVDAITTARHGRIIGNGSIGFISSRTPASIHVNAAKHQQYKRKLIYLITKLSTITKIIETVFLEYLRF